MGEFNKNYPEVARPWEPVKGGKKHTGTISYLKLPFVASVFVLSVAAAVSQEPQKPEETVAAVPVSSPVVSQNPTPSPPPSASPEAVPVVTEKPEPSPSPSPETTPTEYVHIIPYPVPSPSPYPQPVPSPEPEPSPVPDAVPDPEPEPSPEPEPEPSPEPEPEPVTHEEPVFEKLEEISAEGGEGHLYIYTGFSMTLNELKGGSAVVTLYMKNNETGEFEALEDDTAVYEYTGEDEESISAGLEAEIEYEEEEPDFTFKIVAECTYPDGDTATVETNEITYHTGSYVYMDPTYGEYNGASADLSENTLTFDVVIDETKADPEKVEANYVWLSREVINDGVTESFILYETYEAEEYTDSDGKQHIRYTFAVPDGLTAESPAYAEYTFVGGYEYPENDGLYWETYAEMTVTVQ